MRKNICLKQVRGLAHLLRKPLEEITFESPEGIIEALREAEQKITVHLYSLQGVRRKSGPACLLEHCRWYYTQIYLALQKDKVFALMGYGNTSSGRENHNHCLDLLLQDRELRKEIPTAVMVTRRKDILSYYFHETFAYCNHDIDSNWHQRLIRRLPRARIPYSQRRILKDPGFYGGVEIYFHDPKNEESLLYRAVEEDIFSRNISQRQ